MDRKQISTTDGPMIVDSTSSNPLSAGQNQLQTPVGPAQHTVKPCEDSYYEVKRTIDHLLHRSTATAERQPATLKTAPLANSDLDIIRIIESSTRIHYSLYKFQSDVRVYSAYSINEKTYIYIIYILASIIILAESCLQSNVWD